MNVPTFVVAGAQKSATTWLYECLREHPAVFVPATKELHYFCRSLECPKSTADQGRDWYLSQFPSDDRHEAVGELSIDYMYYEGIAERLKDFNPGLKVLFVLRNPVERAYSAYWMERRYKSDMPEFSEFAHERSQYVARGFYYRQIRRYLNVFPRDQVMILLYDDLLQDPRAFVRGVFRFIGVNPEFMPSTLHQRVAQSRALPPIAGQVLYKHVARILKWPPALALWRAIKRHAQSFRTEQSGNAAGTKYSLMRDADRTRLADIYCEENKRLFELIGREIPDWQA